MTVGMWFKRMAIEKESPEEYGYNRILYNLGESSAPDCVLGELNLELQLNNVVLCYGKHRGKPELRERIAAQYERIGPEHILVTNGAAEALFVVAVSLLKPGDEVIVAQPNYPSNYMVPGSLGCSVIPLSLTFENHFELDVDELKGLLRPQTKLISLTYPNNPTGAMITRDTLEAVIELTESAGCYLIFDETYRDLTFGEKLPTAASLSQRAITVSTFSKAYGLPGLRVGWLATQDRAALELFLAAKEQINICNSVINEEIAVAVLEQRDKILALSKRHVRENYGLLGEWLEKQLELEYVKPLGGATCFPRIKEGIPIDVRRFYDLLLNKYRTFVGPGHWFGMNDRYFRIGFGWPSKKNLELGLESITKALKQAITEQGFDG